MNFNQNRIERLLVELNIPYNSNRIQKNWMQIICPFHNDSDFGNASINLETGEPYINPLENKYEVRTYHNIHYDCGGATFEEAIINLANIVYKHNKKLKENKTK